MNIVISILGPIGFFIILIVIWNWHDSRQSAKAQAHIDAEFDAAPKYKWGKFRLGIQCPGCKEVDEGSDTSAGICTNCGYYGEWVLVRYRTKYRKQRGHFGTPAIYNNNLAYRSDIEPIAPADNAIYTACSYCKQPLGNCGCGAQRQ